MCYSFFDVEKVGVLFYSKVLFWYLKKKSLFLSTVKINSNMVIQFRVSCEPVLYFKITEYLFNGWKMHRLENLFFCVPCLFKSRMAHYNFLSFLAVSFIFIITPPTFNCNRAATPSENLSNFIWQGIRQDDKMTKNK